jgi:hypothetical protein
MGKQVFGRFSDPILFSDGSEKARLGHFIFQMS